MLKRYKRDGEIENALKPLETTYPITGDSCSETILSVNGCSLTLDYPIQGILARVTVFLKLGVRIFFWTILVVLTLSLSSLCILLDSCRPR